ncbi:hypothetical protein ACFV4P_35530 [Kitasatospora sp. NPDC059795]|uniref:hypothetical protein n=1 Tax=Kitasatospora sp. NPDC059795 TaxID=3346949 RepID=UPI003662276B
MTMNAGHDVVLLHDPAAHRDSWALPDARVGHGQSWRASGERLIRSQVLCPTIRWAKVFGRTPPRRLDGHATATWDMALVLLAHVGDARLRCGERGIATRQWVPYRDAARSVDDSALPDVGLLIEGYVDGRIPDGPIALKPEAGQ